MNTSKYIHFFKFLKLFIVVFIIGCNNVTDFTYDDAKRNKWLYPFIKEEIIVEGKHDFDKQTLFIHLLVDDVTKYYTKCDSISVINKWNIGYKDIGKRVFVKKLENNKFGINDITIIKITNNGKKNVLIHVY